MSVFNRSEEQRCLEELRLQDEEVIGSLCRLGGDRAVSPGNHMEQEKRIRREIANSNERRRMQSINAGFQSLRTLLPHHEGEKLSKAAILQQTAEYIYQLEQEKTNLLQQNCHLKRLVNQCEAQHDPLSSTGPTAKKRKLDTASVMVTTLPTLPPIIHESSDEGIGSMSPEPMVINTCAAPPDPDPSREMIELRVQLDRERRLRMQLQDQVRTLEHELYPGKIREITQQVQMQYHHQEVVEHENVSLIQETAAAVAQLQVVSASALPPVAQTTTIVATSPVPSPPTTEDQRLPSVLEAAIKAEPKVEVERLPSPPVSEEVTPQAAARLYLASRSRQNLETIVEAIRHLEGDHLFGDEPPQQPTLQEAPLALTKKEPTQQQVAHRLLKVEMNPFLQFHGIPVVTAQRTALQQQRPGVIVVKQQT